jgi:hypothetical protein
MKRKIPKFETSYQVKYNRNFEGNFFEAYLKNSLQNEKKFSNYKPLKSPKKIVFSKCKKLKCKSTPKTNVYATN